MIYFCDDLGGNRRGMGSYRWGMKEEKMEAMLRLKVLVQMEGFIFMVAIKAILQLMTGSQELMIVM